MVNIKEVAAKAGVSPSTVSRALSGKVAVNSETRRRVLAAVRELDYRPNVLAQSLKEGRSKTIGLVIANIHVLAFPRGGAGSYRCRAKTWLYGHSGQYRREHRGREDSRRKSLSAPGGWSDLLYGYRTERPYFSVEVERLPGRFAAPPLK